jgi:peptidyl-prolyl cis-trans isomerase D
MLSSFRESNIGKTIIAVVAFTIIIVFAIEFRAGRGDAGNLNAECTAEVYGYCVRPKEYFAASDLTTMRQLTNAKARELNVPTRVLDGLIERELLVHAADELGLDVGENDVDDELQKGRVRVSLPAAYTSELAYYFGLCLADPRDRSCEPNTEGVRHLDVMTDGKFDYERYARSVRIYANRSPKEFKEMQERETIAARLRALVRSRVRISDAEAFGLFERERSRAVARVVELHASWFAKYALAPTDREIDDFADAHKAEVDAAFKGATEGFKAGCPLASEILFELPDNANEEDKALKRGELQEAEKRLAKGEDFAALARELSDASEAEIGGELGCVTESYGAGAQPLLAALGKLKAGETSNVESVRGFHLVRYSGNLAQADAEKVGRRYVALKLLVQTKGKELAKSFATELIQLASKGEKLEDATSLLARRFASSFWTKKEGDPPGLGDDKRPKLEVSSPFSISGNVTPNLMPSESAARRVFELDKPDLTVAEPVAMFDGFAVLQLKEKNPATRADFDKQRDLLIRSMLEARAEEALTRYVAELRSRLGDKLKIDQPFIDEQTKRGSNDDS